MVDFSSSLPILQLLSLLMLAVHLTQVGATVARCEWVHYPYVEKCICAMVIQESCCTDITASVVVFAA